MRRSIVSVALAGMTAAAILYLPAHAATRNTHVAIASRVRALVGSAHSLGAATKPSGVRIAWTSAATLPTAVAETGGGAAAGSKFYVIGGYNSSGTVVDNNQLYNKGTNTWTQKAVIPGVGTGWADAGFCYNAADKTIHVVNGVDGFSLYAAHQVYNTVTDVWTFAAAPVLSNGNTWYGQDPGCAFIGGKMYVWGGYGCNDTPGCTGTVGILKSTWVYDPSTDTWADTGFLMNHPRLWMGYTGNTTNAFAAGGTDNLSGFPPEKTTEKFTPATGWAATPDLPTALLGPGEGNIKTHLMVWGGSDSTGTEQTKTYHCKLPSCTAWQTTAFNLPTAAGFTAFGSGSALFNAGGYDTAFNVLSAAEHLP